MNLAKVRAFLGRSALHNVPFRGIHYSPTLMTSFRLGDTTFQRRPWRFWDMHLPTRSRSCQNENLPAGLCNIPDTHLPSPWTCNWPDCRTWDRDSTLDVFIKELRHQYSIPRALNPIMFQDTWYSPTVLESRGTFYLYEKVLRTNKPYILYTFPGVYVSVEDFFENCDWNGMVQTPLSPDPLVPDVVSPEKLPLTHSEKGLRLASAEPYRKRTLLDMTRPEGVWTFESRKEWLNRGWNYPAPASWPRIPDKLLPEPFSCAWHAFSPADDWYEPHSKYEDWEAGPQLGLLRRWGVPDLAPVMFMAESHFDCMFYIPTILRTGETYYLWIWLEDPDVYTISPILRKFEGTYASVEDFVENADWNKMYKIELDGDQESYEEEMY
ncbi:hypothetical protein C8F04DRAFT_1081734 [Mycena alexandri]|uniref:Uncharacterized protein n=1 Tax=Mycena alexandri TaxID=1745969 RepID=A0AAD6T7V5_9AGAR|nr:hypothetical protein C8F04DRAFT_1081734 [Mycena alexandri]